MQIERLTSLDDSRLDVYARLTEPQLRNRLEPEKGIFIAESAKVVTRALAAGMKPLSCLLTPQWVDRSAEYLDENFSDTPVYCVDEEELSKLTGFKLTRGILAAFRRPPLLPAEELCRNASRIAVLEDIVDHTNIGAVFRSAAALGVDAVLLTPSCCDPLYRRSLRVSMGTVFQVPWTRIGDDVHEWPDRGLARLTDLGFTTTALALSDDSISIDDPRLHQCEKLALILGTEGDGLRPRTIARCDYTARIPMRPGVDSLNVAAASAVAFWELVRTAR